MTGLLLDTHVALWWLAQTSLSTSAVSALSAGSNQAFVSMASVWEVASKDGVGKLRPPEDSADAVRDEGFELLPIDVEHARAVRELPLHHRDPFDRMLIAQAQVENLTFVTRDRRMTQYDVSLLEA